jgi:PST family polysaccharide transporter
LGKAGSGSEVNKTVSFRRSFVQNTSSLYAAQVSNWILPLVAMPYLLRVLGPSHYGLVAFTQSFMMCLYILIDYGFSISATRKIALERGNSDQISQTACSIWGTQIALGILGFAMILVLTAVVPRLTQAKTLFLVMFGYGFGKAFFPLWLYQGLERMIYIPVVNLTANVLVLFGIFTLIKSPGDYLIYAWLLSLGALGAAAIGIVWAVRIVPLKLDWPDWREITQTLSEGKTIFFSQLSTALVTLNSFVVGLLASNSVVGYYSAAEKIMSGVTNLLLPLSQAAYPSFSRFAAASHELLQSRAKKMLLLAGALGLGATLVLLAGASMIIALISGPQYVRSISVLRILAIFPLLSVLSQVCGLQILLPLHMDRVYTIILLGSSIFSLTSSVLFVRYWQECGMALSVSLTALIASTLMILIGIRRLSSLQFKAEVNF